MTHAVSAAFLEEIRKSHTAVARVDLYAGESILLSSVPVLAGNVYDDSQAMIRRRTSLTLAATDEVMNALSQSPPSDGGLWPLGNELHVHAGVRYGDGTEELVHMGVFRIARPSMSDTGNELLVNLEGYDRSRSVSRARFTEPYSIAAGTNYATAIKNLLLNRLPSLASASFNFMVTTYTTPALMFDYQDDPWDVATKMASSFGAELFFDGEGNPTLRPEPDPAFTPSSFDFIEGEDATLLGIARDLGDEEAYNGVVVIGESTTAPPVRAVVWDTNPDSPTYFDPANPTLSKYGPVPTILWSQYITTQQQAQDAANAELARVLGVLEHIDFNAINNPAMESGDVINIGRDRVNVDAAYILSSVSMGLGQNVAMSGVTRKRRAT